LKNVVGFVQAQAIFFCVYCHLPGLMYFLSFACPKERNKEKDRQKQCSAVFVGPTHNEESVDLKFHFFIAMLG